MKKIIISVVTVLSLISFVFIGNVITQKTESDHSDRIDGPFENPKDVTKACLVCHEEQAEHFIKTTHWNWLGEEFDHPTKGKIRSGKLNIINNFCTSVISNEEKCSTCHPSFGWKDANFDFKNKENIDCLVCHATKESYSKNCEGTATTNVSDKLLKAARSVSRPTVSNCGFCHFNGGGGDNVKHGDLSSVLEKATKEQDVHIGGKQFDCIACHKSEKHEIKGAGHSSIASGTNHIACTDCHKADDKLHKNKLLAKHLNSVACQTCHIPEIATEIPTVTYWDWSTAGQKDEVRNAEGYVIYSKLKGDFKLEKNVVPVYRWFNGSAVYYSIGEKFDPAKVLSLNKLNGEIKDAKAKIYPFKLMQGKQIYDTKNQYLILPNYVGPEGYWKKFDWNKAAEIGMKAAKLDYSGEYGFTSTEMYYPINHSVMPKEKALKCQDCHNNGKRLDWAALGFSADPMKKGGREKNGFVKF
jgi:octaheme c-type cytochrome (tetrathionate reductase family)